MDQAPIQLDVFSSTINDQERGILLAPDCPRSLLVGSISQTLTEVGSSELKNKVAEYALGKVVRGKYIPTVVQEFVDSLTTNNTKLAPYTNGREKEYLAIFCGFMDAMRLFNEKQPELAKQVSEKFVENSEKMLKQNPASQEGKKAVETIAGKFNRV